MANTTVKSAANTSGQMGNTSLNPTVNAANGGRKVVHITIIADGVDITPASIYTALDTQYATVQSPKDTLSRGTWIFNVGPA